MYRSTEVLLHDILDTVVREHRRHSGSTSQSQILDGCKTPFELFVQQVERHSDSPAHNMTELRAQRSTKTKGDIFEAFCCLYLTTRQGYRRAWRLPNAPAELVERLGVAGRDMGIDLVAEDPEGGFAAVQCKYRMGSGFVPGRRIRRDVVPWRDLATFYALCARTGPWTKHVVMTNAVAVRSLRGVPRGPLDTSICRASLMSLTAMDMSKMLATIARPRAQSPPSQTTTESRDALRLARTAFYANINTSK